MNSTPNKAALWKSCVEQGIFDTIPPDAMYQVQGLFERILQGFQDTDVAKSNPLFLKEFRFQLGKLTGQTVQQKSFEELNEEYREQYQPRQPPPIEFSREKDSPLQDLESILKEKSEQRQNEIQEFFKDPKDLDLSGSVVSNATEKIPGPVLGNIPVGLSPMSNPMIQGPGTYSGMDRDKERDKVLALHGRILESILTSQLKIIELLQRK